MQTNSNWRIAALAILSAGLSISAQAGPGYDVTVDIPTEAWNDGGTLSGAFTVYYDAADDPVSVVSMDVTTTTGAWAAGYDYLYNAGSPATVSGEPTVWQTVANGYPANSIDVLGSDMNHTLVLDWQDDPTPGTFYAGDPNSGFFTYEADGQSDGTPQRYVVPEPGSIALAGLGALLLIRFRRGKA